MKKIEDNPIKYDDIVEIHNIKSYGELLDIIQGNTGNEDLRKDFVFRGLKRFDYELIPSSLRKDKKTKENLEINDYIIDSEFSFFTEINTIFKTEDGTEHHGLAVDLINKKSKIIDNGFDDYLNKDLFGLNQFKREIYVLLTFLDYADKIGLKIPTSTHVRRWIHNHLTFEQHIDAFWPEQEFYEIISLAQHNGLPTRVLDWTYDYKVALYFALIGILEKNSGDCILWAFNYKLFENNYFDDYYHENSSYEDFSDNMELVIYRPQYNLNENLKAQKGLFTFLACNSYEDMFDSTPFDEMIFNKLNENSYYDEFDRNETRYYKFNGFRYFELSNNEKIFHKFIIPGQLKAKILNELYLEGYSRENICPNYRNVIKSMKDRVKLDELINE